MSFEKNTVDFLKEYAIRYKKILIKFFLLIIIIISYKTYNYLNLIYFNKNLNSNIYIQQTSNNYQEKFQNINNFYNKYFSYWINHRQIFVLNYTYTYGSELLIKFFSNKPLMKDLIEQGQWLKIKNIIIKDEIKVPQAILNTLDILEKIYQYVLKYIPYTCVLNGIDINHSGENLNLIIFFHIIHRENNQIINNFLHNGCLISSLYTNEIKLIYGSYINKKTSLKLDLYNKKNYEELIKKFINF